MVGCFLCLAALGVGFGLVWTLNLYSCRFISSPLPGAGVTLFAVDQSRRFSALLWSHAKKVTKESSSSGPQHVMRGHSVGGRWLSN